MRLYLIRHAQSENNLLWDMNQSSAGRSDDPALTALGEKQAVMTAAYLASSREEFPKDWQNSARIGFEITHLYSSLMYRALQTASAISSALSLPIVGREDIHECGGVYLDDEETGGRIGQTGRTYRELVERFPNLVIEKEDMDSGWWNRPFETREERWPRALGVITYLREAHYEANDTVAMVTHGAFYNAILSVLLDLPEGHENWFMMNNTAISCFDLWEHGAGINYLNRFCHLPSEMVS